MLITFNRQRHDVSSYLKITLNNVQILTTDTSTRHIHSNLS